MSHLSQLKTGQDKVFLVKFRPVFLILLDFKLEGLRKILGAMRNWGK